MFVVCSLNILMLLNLHIIFLISMNVIQNLVFFLTQVIYISGLVGKLSPNIQSKMQMTSKFTKHSTRHCLICFMHINSLNPHNNSIK